MKSALIIFLSFFYLGTSSGISMNVHFCGSQLSGFELFGKANCCCDKGSIAKKSCCKDHKAFIKIKDEHNASKSGGIGYIDFGKILSPYSAENMAFLYQFGYTSNLANGMDGPPLSSLPGFHLLFGVFRV